MEADGSFIMIFLCVLYVNLFSEKERKSDQSQAASNEPVCRSANVNGRESWSELWIFSCDTTVS